MQDLGWQARLYIWCIIFAGVAIYLWCFWRGEFEHPALLVILSVFAAITHTLKVEGATACSSYQISWIAYGASFALLKPAEALTVLLVAHGAEWLWHKPEWYITLFNVNAFAIVASVSIFVWQTLIGDSTLFAPISALGFFATAATFTALNHFLVGLVIWLARGESLMRSGVFHLLTLMIDFVSFGMGIAAGLIWLVNPYAVVFILSPLYLIYTTLQVPSLQQQTRTEPKTGLYNAKYFAEALKAELERADRFDRPLTIVMADVDLLRNINNTYGHLAGDTVLIGIANILRTSMRDYDVVARFGGEEYAILMPETSLREALPLIERMRAAVEAARFEISTSVTLLSATMSFGVAEREHIGQEAEEIIHNADLAVYQSKATIRNRVYYCTKGEIKYFSGGASSIGDSAATLSTESTPTVVAPQPSGEEKLKPTRRKLDFHVAEATVTPNAGNSYGKLLRKLQPLIVDAFTKVISSQGENLIGNSASDIVKVIESDASFSQSEGSKTGVKDTIDNKLLGTLFSSKLDSMNMALHRALAAHQHMELSAQEGKELAEILLRVASTINTTLKQDRVLALILEQLAHVVQYDSASIMLLEGENLNAVARRSIHVPESQFLSVRVGKLSHVSEVIEHKRAVVITDTHDDSRWMRLQGSETIRCWLGVPLIVQDRVIGLLNLSSGIPASYTDHHLQVAVAFAAHAAIAIENARLYTQAQQELEERERAQAALRQSQAHLQERVIELQRAKAAEQKQRELAETLSEAARSMSASLQLQEVVRTIVVYLSRLVTADSICIKLIVDSSVELLAYYDRLANEYNYADGHFPLLPLEERVVKEATPYVLKERTEDATLALSGSESLMRSWLGVPLTVQDKVIGLLTLAKQEANVYTDHDVTLVAAFANQSAITITNARLYQQVQDELMERMRAEMELQEERALLAQRVEERTFELKNANNKLTAALRTKDEFLATVSHELRTPLSAILLLTESMQNGVYGVLGARHSEVLTTVKHSARHLLSLINDILDMSKIESGMFELDMGLVSVPIICRNSFEIVAEVAHKKQIELVQTLDPRVDMVNGDERRLLQILVNLLSNALKFTPDGGKVGLEVLGDIHRRQVHLTVWDTGIGIAKEDMARLFQPFVQLDSKLSRQYEGTGLGLALVDRLTKLHGGTVVLESEVGKGSRFTISLPWEEQEPFTLPLNLLKSLRGKSPALGIIRRKHEHAANSMEANGNGRQEIYEQKDRLRHDAADAAKAPLILLVEDNAIGIEAMQDYLTAHDYRVIVARNGEEAIEQTNRCKPDLILMDIQMPDMDGLEATKRIRAQDEFTHTPIIALTALAMPGDRERCIQAGVNEYLTKPVSMKQLVNVIRSQLQLTSVYTN